MSLTQDQLTTLKTDILANTDPVVVAARSDGDNNVIRDWYNDPTNLSPDFWGIRNQVLVDEIVGAIDANVDYATNLNAKDFAAMQFVLSNGSYACATAKARNWLLAIFNDAATSQTALVQTIVRKTTPAEKLFAVTATGPGGGDGSNQNNGANLIFEGELTRDDIRNALALP